MNVTTTWRELADGTPVYMFAPGTTKHALGSVRDGAVSNDPNDDICVAYGPAITVDGRRISLTANMMVFDVREERDAVATAAEAAANIVQAEYNAPDARAARQAKLDARDNAREAAAIRHEIDKMNDVLS